jgi:putative transposase
MAASRWPAIRKPGHTAAFCAYARKSKRAGWIAYDQLHAAWQASVGGKDPFRAYRTYVKEGLASPDDPFQQELREWVFGSEDFLRRMVALAEGADRQRHESTSQRLQSVSVEEIVEATSCRHGEDASQYARFRSSAAGRDMAAWLCRRWTGAGAQPTWANLLT